MRVRLLALVAMLCSAVVAGAQPLIERIPGDAVVYVGWYGDKDIQPRYEGTHLQAIVEASQYRQLVEEFLPTLLARWAGEDPQYSKDAHALADIGSALIRNTSAVYIGALTSGEPAQPTPHMAIFVDAGDEADALLEKVQMLLVQLGATPIPMAADVDNGVLRFIVGIVPNDLGKLADNERFKATLQHIDSDPLCIFYADVESILPSIDLLAPRNAEWPSIKSALGLGQLQRIAWSNDFDGKSMRSRGYVQAPAPRTGLLALLDGKPISSELLAVVPESALMATFCSFDLGRLFDETRAAIAKVDARSADEFDEGVAELNKLLKIDLRNDLLAPLGHEWVTFKDDHINGQGVLGLIAVNNAADADKLSATLARLAAMANDAMADSSNRVTIRFQTEQVNGLDIQYLALPIVAPCWAVHEGKLYVALYPQVIVSAIEHQKASGKSLADNADFARLLERSGTQGFTSASYADLPKLMPRNYGSSLLLFRLLGLTDMIGAKSPVNLLPPLHRILPHLEPAAGFGWSDDDGWHFQQMEPFSGATLLATFDIMNGMISQAAMSSAVLLPSLNRSREAANRIKSASNLRQIGSGCMKYANEFNNNMPPSLGALYKPTGLAVEVFISPRSSTQRPGDIHPDEMVNWINENSDYVYLAGGTQVTEPDEAVVAYEKVIGYDGTNVLFADFHVEWVTMEYLYELAEEGGFEVEFGY